MEEVGGCRFDPRSKGYEDEDPIQLVRRSVFAFQDMIREVREEDWDSDGTCFRKLKNFTTNDRNRAIERIPGYGFKRTGSQKFFQGVIPRLRRNLWPWNDGDPKKRWRKRAPPSTRSKYFDVTGLNRSCATYGDVHGTIVSQELEICAKAVEKCEDLEVKSADPCTARILDCLNAARWVPVAAELPVWDGQENVATALDLLAVDVDRAKVVAIEVKTGYENEEYGPLEQDPPLLEPFHWLKDCPEHRHQLQLAATVHLLEKGHGERVDESYVMQACSKRRGVMLMKSPQWSEWAEVDQWMAQALRRNDV